MDSNTSKVFEARSNELKSTSELEWTEVDVTGESGACAKVMLEEDC